MLLSPPIPEATIQAMPDAADLCQDVLAAVAGAVSRLEYDPARGAFRNWLFTIVRRKLSNAIRARKGQPQAGLDDAALRLIEQRPAPEDEAVWQAEWERRLFAWACEQVRKDVGRAPSDLADAGA